ncbi:MAG TPA: AmmeMemoRadiSam system protein A [Casimicrobiaceae bacterium]|nr:AmmeMemoRadiSam system protein A [Casimicrobiaceae bacterium]
MTGDDLGSALLVIARTAIAESLGLREAVDADHAALALPAATFVTLKRDGELRGCIGTLEPFRPLREDVRANAIGAAFRDPRFLPLRTGEFEAISVEVSLLSASERIDLAGEDDLLAMLRAGHDGLTLEYGRHRATLLPQVWDQLADPRDFVVALKRKAGLPADFWNAGIAVSRYQVTRWVEADAILAGAQS